MECLSNEINIYPYIILALLLSGLWLASKFDIFKDNFKKIKKIDQKGILLPSLCFITSPFIVVYIIFWWQSDTFYEVLRSLAPVASVLTFFLGQLYEKNRNNQNKHDREKYVAKRLLYSLGKIISLMFK